MAIGDARGALGEAVADVRISDRLTDSAVCLVDVSVRRTWGSDARWLPREGGSGPAAELPNDVWYAFSFLEQIPMDFTHSLHA
jgi:hypothetical protein